MKKFTGILASVAFVLVGSIALAACGSSVSLGLYDGTSYTKADESATYTSTATLTSSYDADEHTLTIEGTLAATETEGGDIAIVEASSAAATEATNAEVVDDKIVIFTFNRTVIGTQDNTNTAVITIADTEYTIDATAVTIAQAEAEEPETETAAFRIESSITSGDSTYTTDSNITTITAGTGDNANVYTFATATAASTTGEATIVLEVVGATTAPTVGEINSATDSRATIVSVTTGTGDEAVTTCYVVITLDSSNSSEAEAISISVGDATYSIVVSGITVNAVDETEGTEGTQA